MKIIEFIRDTQVQLVLAACIGYALGAFVTAFRIRLDK
jgi:hypothetical protein